MSDNGRTQIMQNIRQAVNNPQLTVDRQREMPTFESQPFESRALVSRWQQELEALTGHVYGPLSPDAALDQVIALIQEQQAEEILAWDDTELPVAGLSPRLQANDIRVVQPNDSLDSSMLVHSPRSSSFSLRSSCSVRPAYTLSSATRISSTSSR